MNESKPEAQDNIFSLLYFYYGMVLIWHIQTTHI